MNLLELRNNRSAAGARQDAVYNRGDVRDVGPVRRRPRCVNDGDQAPNVGELGRGLREESVEIATKRMDCTR